MHTLQVSAANYGWGNVDQIAVGQASGVLTSILTNEVVRDADGNIGGFASRFNVVDIISEATFQTSQADYPLRLLAEFAHNTRATSGRDNGFWVEAEYGRPRRAGTWGATYTYGWIEQDVTLSAFVFSDMPGDQRPPAHDRNLVCAEGRPEPGRHVASQPAAVPTRGRPEHPPDPPTPRRRRPLLGAALATAATGG